MKNFLSKLSQDEVSENQVLSSGIPTEEGSKKTLFQKSRKYQKFDGTEV